MDGRSTTWVTGEATPEQRRRWDRFVASVEQSDVAQLSPWARIRSSAGFSPLYTFVSVDGELVAGAQVLVRRIPLVGSVGYLSYGPVIADGLADRPGVCADVCRGVHTLMAKGHMRLLFVQPPVGGEDASAGLAALGFRPSDAGIAPPASLRIDLTSSQDELRGRLNKRLRTWTTRWAERGVTVRVGGDEDLPLLADLLARSAEHQGFEPIALDYLRQQYGELAPEGNAVLFVGEVHDKPVAVDLFTACGGVLRDRLIGLDRDSEASNLSVPGAIKWNALLWAKENGFRWFDFGGVRIDVARTLIAGQPLDQDTVTGSDRFKLSFGGEAYVLPLAVELARPRQLFRPYDLARRSERGRALLGTIRRRLRGGRR